MDICDEDLNQDNDPDTLWKQEIERKWKEMLWKNRLDEHSDTSMELGDLEIQDHEIFKPDINNRQLTNAMF